MKTLNVISRLFGSRSGRTSDAADLRYWLLVYDPVEQELVGEEEFLDRDEAEVAYSRLEAEHRSANGDRQVVLFGAPSREALEHTHPHYFRRAEQTGDTLDFMPV